MLQARSELLNLLFPSASGYCHTIFYSILVLVVYHPAFSLHIVSNLNDIYLFIPYSRFVEDTIFFKLAFSLVKLILSMTK
jgi:hypothetical protein